jgi:hypothetical protein
VAQTYSNQAPKLLKPLSIDEKKNTFKSTPEYLDKIAYKSSKVSAAIYTYEDIYVNYDKGPLKANVPLYFVPANFFKFLEFDLIWGRLFNSQESFSNNPKAVITTGFLRKVSGKLDIPRSIKLDQLEVTIVGLIDIGDSIEEAEGIFMNLSAHGLIGTSFKTYVNRFVLKNSSTESLSELREKISDLQVLEGLGVRSPDFLIKPFDLRPSSVFLLKNKIPQLKIITWFLLFILVLCVLKDMPIVFKECEHDIFLRIVAQKSRLSILRLYLTRYIQDYLFFTLKVVSLSILFLFALKTYSDLPLKFTVELRPITFAIFVPIIFFSASFYYQLYSFHQFQRILRG